MEQIEHGYCDICEKEVDFRIDGEYLRNHFFCTQCNSIPRQRAFIHVLKLCCPNWRTAFMHESSPGGSAFDFLYHQAKNYTFSYYYPGLPSGEIGPHGVVCQNLETMSFEDNTFDVFITQDVLEHVFDISAVFNEMKRVLKPGGFHLFTVPCYDNQPESFCRASRLEDGSIQYHADPVYHGNPIDQNGSLVTWDYGRDFQALVYRLCGLHTTVYRVMFQPLLIIFGKPALLRAVDIKHSDNLISIMQGQDDLGFGRTVACDMAGKHMNIFNSLDLILGHRSTTHTLADRDTFTSRFTLKRPKNQFSLTNEIKTCPVDAVHLLHDQR